MILASLGRAYPRKHLFFNKNQTIVKRGLSWASDGLSWASYGLSHLNRTWVELSLVRDFREITKIQLFSHFFWKKHFRNERYWADFKNFFLNLQSKLHISFAKPKIVLWKNCFFVIATDCGHEKQDIWGFANWKIHGFGVLRLTIDTKNMWIWTFLAFESISRTVTPRFGVREIEIWTITPCIASWIAWVGISI